MSKRIAKPLSLMVVLLFVLSIVLSGCGQQASPAETGKVSEETTKEETQKPQEPAEKPVIRVAHTYTGNSPYAKWFEPYIQQFADTNKDVAEFQFEPETGDDLRTKIKTDMAAGNLPDIWCYWPGGAMKPFVENGLLVEMGDFINKSKEITGDSYPAPIWDIFSYDGGKTRYGFPLNVYKVYTLANKKIFDQYGLQIPKTFEEFKEVAKVLNKNKIIPLAVGSKGGNTSHWYYAFLLNQFVGSDYVNGIKEGTTKFTDEKLIKAAELVVETAKAGIFPKDTMTNSEYSPTMALYNEGKAAMIHGFAWTTATFKPEVLENSVLIDIPMYTGATVDPSTFTIGGVNFGWVINKKSFDDPGKQDIIVKFMDSILSDEAYVEFVKSGSELAKNLKSVPTDLFSPLAQKAYDFNKTKEVRNELWSWLPGPISQEAFCNKLDALWAQAISPEDFCKDIQATIEKESK